MIQFLKNKIVWFLIATGFIVVGFAAELDDPVVIEPVSIPVGEETLFAEVREDGIVLRVIVADQNFVDNLGGKNTWVNTSKYGTVRKNYAGKGYLYDESIDAFIPPKGIGDDLIFDSQEALWLEPIVIEETTTSTST